MNITNFLASLKQLNISIILHDGNLRVTALPGVLTIEIRDKIKKYKTEIINHLDSESTLRKHRHSITKITKSNNMPVSYTQQRLFYLDLMTPNKAIYNEIKLLRIVGNLDIDYLNKSFNLLIQRHEILRTVYTLSRESVTQHIKNNLAVSIPTINISDISYSDLKTYLFDQMNVEGSRAFDLSSDLLIKIKLYKHNHEYYLLIVMHQIVCDGWTFSLMFDELAEIYNSLKNNINLENESKLLQYVDYACWQRSVIESGNHDNQLKYWKNNLKSYTSTLDLPVSETIQQPTSDISNYYNFVINSSSKSKLLLYAKEKNVTPYVILLACFYILLSRYSNQNDIAIGSPVANRTLPELEKMIGCFLNTIIIRVNFDPYLSFDSLVSHIKKVVIEAFDNQDIPVDIVIEELRKDHNLISEKPFDIIAQQLNLSIYYWLLVCFEK